MRRQGNCGLKVVVRLGFDGNRTEMVESWPAVSSLKIEYGVCCEHTVLVRALLIRVYKQTN